MKARVPGIGGDGAAEGFGGGARVPGVHGLPAAPFEQRVPGVDLSRRRSGEHRQAQQERGEPAHLFDYILDYV